MPAHDPKSTANPPPNQSPSIDEAQRITFRYERWRAVAAGILETAGSTFLLLIVVSHFHAGENAKALIAAGGNYGLLFTPLVVFLAASFQWRVSKAAAAMAAVGSAGFLLAALIPHLWVFIGGSMVGMICATAFIPLLTQLYQDNYPAEKRGQIFSKTVIIRILAAAAFSHIAGKLLNFSLDRFQWILFVFCGALAVSSYCLSRCPSRPLARDGHTHPFKGFRHVRDDALFRQTLISWMLMGFANLTMYQLRVEYLANEKYGPPLQPEQIALLIGVIPNIARLIFSSLWGKLFDRMNFFGLRILLNIGFALGALTFFAGRDMLSMAIGAVIFGAANAGGEVAWSLWVTKLAPPHRVAEYMSVHTFLTGCRGVLAPVAGFYLLNVLSFQTLSALCASMILAASLLLVPEILASRSRMNKPAEPLVEEISE